MLRVIMPLVTANAIKPLVEAIVERESPCDFLVAVLFPSAVAWHVGLGGQTSRGSAETREVVFSVWSTARGT